MARAKILNVGDDQYVLLPEGMTIDAKEVRITPAADGLVIKPRRRGRRRGGPAQAPLELAAAMKASAAS